MRKSPFILLLIINFGCSKKPSNEISGVWAFSNNMEYVSDTISIESGLNGIIKTSIQTDSGIVIITHIQDSIISVKPSSKKDVLEIYFDNEKHGIISLYQIDSNDISSREDPKWTASNNSFWVYNKNSTQYLIIDSNFDRKGNRILDTIKFQLLNPNLLILNKDTLTKINKP
ncbi:hypothetical protein [Marivirga atlantica]|jgi:hypothetical protein|uniref:Uncharacterized protein n=1 Tax=Marivirga atlantica TaxID=1548457 RepID=A0A937A7C1_9BACT|nr:hypothetical protein [Marivirga atlantica]MBL0764950.1 hypothetical protein [Marivirga atlantica]